MEAIESAWHGCTWYLHVVSFPTFYCLSTIDKSTTQCKINAALHICNLFIFCLNWLYISLYFNQS